MGSIISRKVKGKEYFYIEQTIRIGKKYQKISVYLGNQKPLTSELPIFKKKLQKRVNAFYSNELLKPETSYVNIAAAKKLETIKQETNTFIENLNSIQKKHWIERERERFITNTNAIEGSTLTLNETHRILKLDEKIGTERERLEVLNMEKCLQRYDQYLKINQELNEKMVLQLHYILLDKIPHYDQYKGIWRPVDVEIRTSQFEFPHFQYVPGEMRKLFEWYYEKKDRIHPLELAAVFHCQFTTIHPFADGNGRISRLLMNYILQYAQFPFTNIPYSKQKEYFETQEKGHHSQYQLFTQFLIKQLQQNYREIKK
ncbi:MAG: Fic family protein [Candidatus Diapherotrites archaeon]|nr:Fic family protein [Candidatus Diapherotrites archaeon]